MTSTRKQHVYIYELFDQCAIFPINNANIIVLFKSLRNRKRRNKGNFTLKSNLNKVMLCKVGGNIILL